MVSLSLDYLVGNWYYFDRFAFICDFVLLSCGFRDGVMNLLFKQCYCGGSCLIFFV